MRTRSFASVLAFATFLTATVGAPAIAAEPPQAGPKVPTTKPVTEASLADRLAKAKSLIDKVTIADQLEAPVRFGARNTFLDDHNSLWANGIEWISPADKQIGIASGGVVGVSFRSAAKHSYLVDCAVTGASKISIYAKSVDLGATPDTLGEIATQVHQEFSGDLTPIKNHVTFALTPTGAKDVSFWMWQTNSKAFTFHHCLVTPVAQ